MKVLFLTFYYAPDFGPGALRAKALVEALEKRIGKELELDVLTTMPHRFGSCVDDAPESETCNSGRIKRLPIKYNNSGILKQVFAFAAYAVGVFRLVRGKKYDLVIVSSSRLMTAALAARIAQRCRAPLYLDIRDLFLENLMQIFAYKPLRLILPFVRIIERYIINKATRINLISRGFLPYAKKNWGFRDYHFFTNGVDEMFCQNVSLQNTQAQVPIILYAGNFGYAQALHRIVPQAAKKLEGKVRFVLIGDGACKKNLIDKLRQLEVTNVELLPVVPREKLLPYYEKADILFLHLNEMQSLKHVIPSKLFEYAATGKRILAGSTGFTADFMHKNINGIKTFTPCDVDALLEAIDVLLLYPIFFNRKEFCRQFSRISIMEDMVNDIADCIYTKPNSL